MYKSMAKQKTVLAIYELRRQIGIIEVS